MSETKYKEFLHDLDKRLDLIAVSVLNKAQDNLIKNKSFVTGFLLRSGNVDRKFLEKEVVFDAPYSIDVEYGSEPKEVPITDLFNWARKKFNMPDKEAMRVAIGVHEKIKREGSSPHPYLRPALFDVKNDVRKGKI